MRRDWGNSMSRNREGSTELQVRQKEQLEQFYSQLDQQKEHQLRVDQVNGKLSFSSSLSLLQESRKHHDTLLPSQKSPVPLNRSTSETFSYSIVYL